MNIAHKTRTWVGRAPMSFPLVGALCAMALARAALAAGAADAAGMGKKFVLYGWDTGDASLETVLANADKFADTGLDGISLSIRGNRAGDPRLSQTRDFAFTDPPWTKEEFAADETVWIFGERRQIVEWEGNAERWKGVETWEQALPGFADALRRLRDPRGWARKRLAAHRRSGGLTNLVASVGIETWQGNGDPGTLEIGDDGLLRAKGARDGWFLTLVHGVRAGEWYLAEFEVKGETAPRSGFHWMENGAWRWDVAERFPTYDAPASPDGWRRGFVVARVPHGVDTMSLSLGVKHKEDGETTLFRNVEIFRLVD